MTAPSKYMNWKTPHPSKVQVFLIWYIKENINSLGALCYKTSGLTPIFHIMERQKIWESEFPHLEVLEVRPFLVDHLGQQLVLQTIPGHCKIDEGGLGLDLWLVVRIGQLGVQDESEARVEETLLVSDFYAAVREQHGGQQTCKSEGRGRISGARLVFCAVLPALLDGVSSQQRIDNGVNGLLEVLYEDSVSCHDGLFYHIYITATTQHNNEQACCCFTKRAFRTSLCKTHQTYRK